MILNKSKRIVIKIGSSLLIKKNKINTTWVNRLSEDISKLWKNKIQIINWCGRNINRQRVKTIC